MAKDKTKQEITEKSNQEEVKKKPIKKKVVKRYIRNITPMKVEVPFGDTVIRIKPNELKEVPEGFIIPQGIGLVEH